MDRVKGFFAELLFVILLVMFVGLSLAFISVGLFIFIVLVILGAGLSELFDIIHDDD